MSSTGTTDLSIKISNEIMEESEISEDNRGIREARSKQIRLEKIEKHLNSLHDFVRVIDSRLAEKEYRIDALETWKKSHSAKHAIDTKGDKKIWAEVQEVQEKALLKPVQTDPRQNPRGQRNNPEK